jgi:hypothetical protein
MMYATSSATSLCSCIIATRNFAVAASDDGTCFVTAVNSNIFVTYVKAIEISFFMLILVIVLLCSYRIVLFRHMYVFHLVA